MSDLPAAGLLPLRGSCLCGGVRYEVDEELVTAGYCHCTRCQHRTGTAAAASGQIVPGSLRVVAGEELIRAWAPGGGGFEKCFCGECGSALWSVNPADRDQLFIRLGTFDTDPRVRPQYRQFVGYAAPWEPVPDDGLPRYPERRPVS
jgi:hypothetical protein